MFLIETFGIKFAFISVATVIALASISNNSIIFSAKSQIKGLTTYASLWACGMISIAIGIGFYTIALIGFVVLLWFKDVLAGYKILGNVKFSPEMKMLSHKFSRVNSTEEIMDIKKHWEETTSSLFCALARFK